MYKFPLMVSAITPNHTLLANIIPLVLLRTVTSAIEIVTYLSNSAESAMFLIST